MHLLEEVLKRVQKVSTGTEFSIDDLFAGLEWKAIARSDRLLIGKLFLTYVNENPSLKVKALRKNSNNKQIYQKL